LPNRPAIKEPARGASGIASNRDSLSVVAIAACLSL
jgi:hypothetical protein